MFKRILYKVLGIKLPSREFIKEYNIPKYCELCRFKDERIKTNDTCKFCLLYSTVDKKEGYHG